MSQCPLDNEVIARPELSRLTLDEWHEFAEGHPDRTIFHHRNWIGLLTEQYQLPLHILAVKEGGEILAAVPFLETKNPWGTKKLISLPFTDCMYVLAQEDRASHLMAEGLRSESFGNVRSVVLRTDSLLDGFAAVSTAVRHEMSLARRIDEIAAHFPSSLKRNLRKATRSDLRFERKRDAAAVESFYRLHLATRKKHGIPIQPKSFFRRLFEHVLQCNLGFIGVVSKGNVPIAAAVFLTYNQTMIYKYGASDPRSLGWRPNDFMFYNVIRLAAEEGYVRFDFGISSKQDKGLRRFKSKWGAAESSVYNVYFAGPAHRPLSDSKIMRIASTVIQHSPAVVCRALGELFYRFGE